MFNKMDVLLMVKVAEMHYLLDMDNDEIAEKLRVSASVISGILEEAVELGIVEVKIRCFA